MTPLDLAVIAAYGALVLGIGLGAARPGQRPTQPGQRPPGASEWHLGARSLPTGAVLVSLVATELSAATFLGVPHAAYSGDWWYLQLAFGALLGKLALSRWVIPHYRELGVVTVYGFLQHRYGPRSRRAAAACFLAGRLLASGARLFIAALAASAATGWPVEAAIAVCAGLAGAYTLAGGIRSVVWTDLLQAAVFLAAGLFTAAVLAAPADPGTSAGLPSLWSWAAAAERTRIFHLDPLFALADARALGSAVLGGFFLTLATHATDHDMVQRLLTTRSARGGSRALAWSAAINFPVTLLFLSIGTGLAHFYAAGPPAGAAADSSRIVPLFALTELPSGLRGLFFAGVFAAAMSSLDSAICAMSTTWTVDIRPLPRTHAHTTGAEIRRARATSAVIAAALAAAAMALAAYQRALAAGHASPTASLLELALSSMTVLYGGLLGIFALGLLTRRSGSDRGALAGLAAGAAVGLGLFLHPILLGETWIAWTWWIPIGAGISAGVAWASGAEFGGRSSTGA